jgi:hypothetical protein
MHPALISVLIAEHERDLARRTRRARQLHETRSIRSPSRQPGRAQRLTRAFARAAALLS